MLGDFKDILVGPTGFFRPFGVFSYLFKDDSYGVSAEYLPDYDNFPASDYRGLPANAKAILGEGQKESEELEKYLKELSRPPKTPIRAQVQTRDNARQKLPSDKVKGEDKPKEDPELDEKIRDSED